LSYDETVYYETGHGQLYLPRRGKRNHLHAVVLTESQSPRQGQERVVAEHNTIRTTQRNKYPSHASYAHSTTAIATIQTTNENRPPSYPRPPFRPQSLSFPSHTQKGFSLAPCQPSRVLCTGV
jgi:hypothetical protein